MTNQLTGAEIVFKALEEHGVEYIFGYPGGAVLPMYDQISKQKKIRVVTFFDLIYSLGPNIAEPIRISVAPNFIASSKTLLIPIETL